MPKTLPKRPINKKPRRRAVALDLDQQGREESEGGVELESYSRGGVWEFVNSPSCPFVKSIMA
ncbi:MAG: hypothetical protein QW371_02110 [Candidatus Bathyarchaeia archaeon]